MPEAEPAVERVISGGQTGADLAGVAAAHRAGIATGGWMPRGFLTEKGPLSPLLVERYGFREHASASYPPRTFANVRDADATIRFARDFATAGERCTLRAIEQYAKAYIDVPFGPATDYAGDVREWLVERQVRVLNVAGNRESTTPGIGAFVEDFLRRVLGR